MVLDRLRYHLYKLAGAVVNPEIELRKHGVFALKVISTTHRPQKDGYLDGQRVYSIRTPRGGGHWEAQWPYAVT